MSLDTTVGGTASESYASVAEADAYLAFRGDTSTWTALTTTAKELKLKWACIILNTLFWRGMKPSQYQVLDWPRWNLMDKSGFPVPSTTIPTDIKNAQIELAFQLIAADWTQGIGPSVPSRVKVGSIEVENQTVKKLPAFVLDLLRPYLAAIPGAAQVVRG